MYFYKIYGLNIKCYREIKELVKIDETNNTDIEVILGEISDDKKELLSDGRWIYYSKDFSVFKIKDNGTYLIENGNKIIVQEEEGYDDDTVKTFILGTALGLCLKQRNIVAIHGGSILIDDSVVIFTGESGAGKSTITNRFRDRGFKFLADDVSTTDTLGGEVIVNPAYPQQKICSDAMEKMGYDINDYRLIDECRGKYVIPARESFVYESKKLRAICEIKVDNVEDVTIEEVKAMDKISIIMKNIYREEIFLRSGLEPEYFKKVVFIAQNISVYRMIRPKDSFSVDKQIDTILEKINYKKSYGVIV